MHKLDYYDVLGVNRDASGEEIKNSIRKKLPGIKGAKVEFMDLARMIKSAGTGQIPIEVKIFGKDIEKLAQIANGLVADCKDS